MTKKIPLFSLVLLIVAAIDSIRTLPTTALFGPSLIFFFIVSALFFLIPVAFISAEFASRYPNEGGVYYWIKHAFGARMGTLAVWLQWINTMVWYPTMLLFIAGTAAYLIDPALAANRWFLLLFALFTFWGLTLLNLKGIQVSARINAFCGTIGTIVPMLFLIALGVWWVILGNPLAVSFDNLVPAFDLGSNGIALVTIMASFLGMELSGVHVSDIANPQKNFPKAIGYSVLILLATLILGALSVAIVIPKENIQYVDGVMQTFTMFLNAFHMPILIPVLAFLIIVGSIGGSVNWLLSPAKGLFQAAEHGFLPKFFMATNKHGTAVRILIAQAILVSLFCLSIQFMPSVNSFYWFLMALSTGLYMVMYILLFLAALKLKRTAQSYRIPRGLRTISCLAGLFGCVMTIIVGFEPPPGYVIESKLQYMLTIGLGFALLILPVLFLFAYQKKRLVAAQDIQG
ncbi:MAG: APC family permease [Parachlamydiales bacterium]|nr:APC family permease [Parachlamydiales bacterium]